MTIRNRLVTAWNILTGRVLLNDIAEADEYIQRWLSVYSGVPDWLDYEYVALTGNKQTRRRKSLNAAKIGCSELAGLVWAEKPAIEADQSILEFLESEHFFDKCSKLTEYGAALGGFALKLYSSNGELSIDYVSADCFIPVTWDSSGITEADFVDRRVKDGKVYVRLESHRKKENGYEITQKVFEETGHILTPRRAEDIGISSEPVFIPSPVPLFSYVATSEANNKAIHSPLGISIFGNALDTLESIDIAFDALQHEIIMGKRRIIVPASCVRVVMDTQSGKPVTYFDPADETFVAFNSSEAEGMKITDNTVELRIDQIKTAIQVLLNILSIQLGFSAGFFSFDGVSMKTATEVISENSKTFKTKQAFENNIGAGILALLEAIRFIGPMYGIATSAAPYSIAWNDAVIEDRAGKAAYWNGRYIAGTATLEQVLMHLDSIDEEEAAIRAEMIRAGKATIDVGSAFGEGF